MRRVAVIGAGKRVVKTALPALQRAAASFAVDAVYARSERDLEVEGVTYAVRALAGNEERALAAVDLVYLAVGKDAVPKVLARLLEHDVSRIDLLIDTPVVRFKHFRHAAAIRRFRDAWVAEDCAYLPWLDTVRAACGRDGPVGALQHVAFERSAYAYHGLATAKALFSSDAVVRARRKRVDASRARREITLAGGGRATIVEPRDYASGHIVLEGARGAATDRADRAGAHAFEPILVDGECSGFRIGAVETRLDTQEIELARGDPPSASVTARMESMKRVGFLRLLRAIDAGRGAYPVDAGLDDMVVDYWLEKLGFWLATPVTSPRAALGRWLLATASRAGN